MTDSADPEKSPRCELLPPLFSELPAELADLFDPAAPWALLGDPLDALLAALPSERIEARLSPDVYLSGDRIAIGRGSRIAPGVMIEGPISIGRDVDIRTGAYLRAGAFVGDGCVVGANTEVKRSVMLPGAKAPHLAYVGDSILGREVNLGAGTVLSNFRHDGGEIMLPCTPLHPGGKRLESGRRKLGAVLGDRVAVGCNCVLHPGVVVGRGTQIYPGVQLRSGLYPADAIVKLRQEIAIEERRR